MTVQITILSGKLVHDTELIDQMTPYIRIFGASNKIYVTKDCTGSTPQWNQRLECSVQEKHLIFQVYDRQTLKEDDYVGNGVLDFRKIISKPNVLQTEYVELKYDGSPAGTLVLTVIYKDGLKFIGSETPMLLDLHGCRLRVGRRVERQKGISQMQMVQIRGKVKNQEPSNLQQKVPTSTFSAKLEQVPNAMIPTPESKHNNTPRQSNTPGTKSQEQQVLLPVSNKASKYQQLQLDIRPISNMPRPDQGRFMKNNIFSFLDGTQAAFQLAPRVHKKY